MRDIELRIATEADVSQMNTIYNSYIVDSHVSFDTEPWPDEKRLGWFRERVAAGYPIIVACEGETIIGVSWSGPYRPKAAYRSSAETTLVLAAGEFGKGIGIALYSKLMELLTDAKFHRAYAIIALPNDASIALHHKLGFREIGVLEEAGFKDGKYHSTMMMERELA
jgi:phosphinothricin acetyltransferase